MSTLRKMISDVRSMHRMLSSDNLITDRVIASEIRMVSSLLIKQETNLRKLWSTDTLFKTIPCLEMIEVPISECCDYVENITVSRSKYKLPKISEGNYKYLIQGVYTINALGGKGKQLKEITINRYINLLKLRHIKDEVYFWIIDNYLYTNNSNLQKLRISANFESDIPKEILYPTNCDCGNNASLEEICRNPLDEVFNIPGYLEKRTLDIVSQKLLTTYFKVKTDITDNGVDGQAINTPINS